MNQVFAGGLALIIALIFWSSKKQSKPSAFFKSQKDSFTKGQLSLTSLVVEKNLKNHNSSKLNNKKSKTFKHQISLNSIETRKKLIKLISSNPNDRLLAIEIASKWRNNKALPFLRRGLRDSDSRVVIASAAAISFHKGKTIDLSKKSQTSRPPRNISLMR
tara:strand:- start:31 stop:513 length:483 start_codon:yes stop_codon:yes gene_type:complete